MAAISSTTSFDIILSGKSEPITIFLKDPKTDEPTDVVASSTFSLINIEDDSVLVSDTFTATGGTLISHPGIGIYQYTLDTATYTGEYILSFDCILASEKITLNVFVKSVPSKMFAHAAELRVQVDKARKSVSDDIENMDKPEGTPATQFFYGYSDAHLIYYLERGAQLINLVPPYTSFDPITFPWASSASILIEAGVIAALESQGIFAIDTDYNYSLGGNSLVIDHFTKINSFLGTILTSFDKNVVRFKQQFRSKGLVMIQFLPGGVRTSRTLNSLPSGFWSRMLSSSFI